jgi:tripartite-type tricarboxylate transporter receptor subunit TctC
MTDVAKSPADGYHLIIGHIGTLAVNPFAMDRQPYDVNKDFVPVASSRACPNLFVVNAERVPRRISRNSSRSRKSKPGELNYGRRATGSAGHLCVRDT